MYVQKVLFCGFYCCTPLVGRIQAQPAKSLRGSKLIVFSEICVSERIHHPVGRFFVGLLVVWVVYTPDVCFLVFLCACAYTPPVVASGCAWCIRQMCVFLDFICFCVYTTQRDFLKAKGVVNRRISSVGRPEARPSLAGPPACGTPGVALAGPAWAGLAWPGPPAPDQPGLP